MKFKKKKKKFRKKTEKPKRVLTRKLASFKNFKFFEILVRKKNAILHDFLRFKKNKIFENKKINSKKKTKKNETRFNT